MRRAGQSRRKPGLRVAAGLLDLFLDQPFGAFEICLAEVGAVEMCLHEQGVFEMRALEQGVFEMRLRPSVRELP